MPIDPDVQPLLDTKADKSALDALLDRVTLLESQATHAHPQYAAADHVHGEPEPPPPPPTGTVIYSNDLSSGNFSGFSGFTPDAPDRRSIIDDPTGSGRGKVLRLQSNSANPALRSRIEGNLYGPDPDNLPPDSTYSADFYLETNSQAVNIFQHKQAFIKSMTPGFPNDPTSQTRVLLWFFRLEHKGSGSHELQFRGKLYPDGSWWEPTPTVGGKPTYTIATCPTPVLQGQWYNLELRVKFDTTNAGRLVAKLNGVTFSDETRVTLLPLTQNGQLTYLDKPKQWTVNNYMTSGPWNPPATSLLFDNLKIRTP